MAGMINDDSGLIKNSTGMINQDAGLINENTGMINDSTGLITDINDTKYTVNGRKKRSRERGKDNKPRNYPLHTMKNLPQFRDKPHQEVRQYILEKKGVDIGGNFNLGSIMMPILIVSAIVAGGYGLYWWIKQLEKRREVKRNEIVTNTYEMMYG